MCSTNPGDWVTFDDDPAFRSSPKSRAFPPQNEGVCRPNGLQLSLSGPKDFPSAPSSASSTPLPSPCVDFYCSPGPPSNSPLSTPTKDFPGFPGLPKAGPHVLHPIPERSSNSPVSTSGGDSSVAPSKPTCLSHALLPSGHPCVPLTPQVGRGDDPSPRQVEGLQARSEALQCLDFPEDCAFADPFWKDEGRPDPPRDPEVPPSQRSLSPGSLGDVCRRLAELRSAERAGPGDPAAFVPRSLFRSRPRAGWSLLLRIPEKKNVMSSRQWGPVFLRVLPGAALQLFYDEGLETPFRELRLDARCRLSEPRAQGELLTVKVERVSYPERRRCPPRADAEQVLKLGSTEPRDLLAFVGAAEEALARLPAARGPRRSREEPAPWLSLEVLDGFWGRVARGDGRPRDGAVLTRLCCLGFVGGARCFLSLNDLERERRAGEPAGPGIRMLDYHLHGCADAEEFRRSRVIRFAPPDACRFELMRFRTPCRGGDLPFSLKSLVVVQGASVELQAFVNMTPAARRPPHAGSWRGCDNVAIHFPVPRQWEKVLCSRTLPRRRSLKAKVNPRARLRSCQEPDSQPPVQVTVGSAKYESAYRAVVWTIERLPDKNAGPDQPHCLSYKLELGSDQEIPSDWDPFATVQFSVPDSCASGTEVRSLGVESDVQPQKHILQRAHYNIQVEIEKKWVKTDGEDPDKAGGCATQ